MSNTSATDQALRHHLAYLLGGGGAHADFETLVHGISLVMANRKHEKLPYTIWQVLEHMRIAQWDIIEFSRNPNHQSPAFPDGYWPQVSTLADEAAWNSTIETFRSDLSALQQMVADPETDLFSPIEHGNGQTILREVLLVADHNSYHLGAVAVMKRVFS